MFQERQLMTNKTVSVRFLIGVRWDGVEQLFTQRFIKNAAQFCIDRAWRRIDGVDFSANRFVVYTNPYPIITGYNAAADEEYDALDEAVSEYEESKKKSSSEEDDYF